jgi:hypothetical protein
MPDQIFKPLFVVKEFETECDAMKRGSGASLLDVTSTGDTRLWGALHKIG